MFHFQRCVSLIFTEVCQIQQSKRRRRRRGYSADPLPQLSRPVGWTGAKNRDMHSNSTCEETVGFPTAEFHSTVKSVFKQVQRRGTAVDSDHVRLVNGENVSWKVLVKNILNTNTLAIKEQGKVT